MHGEPLNAFGKLMAKKKTILKLGKELSQLINDFECFKEEHASLVNEILVIPCLEPCNTLNFYLFNLIRLKRRSFNYYYCQ